MKYLLSILCGLACLTAEASTNSFLVGSLASVNGTNTSGSVVTGIFPLPGGTFYVQNGGLRVTNDLTMNVQWSTDNSNWVTVATYYPSISATNAGVERYTMPVVNRTNYFRTQVVTTNAINVGLNFQQ